MKPQLIVAFALLLLVGTALFGQSPAALDKLQQRYPPEHVQDMRTNAHYKYEGLLLYYSQSFLVMDNGQARPASEAEIAAVDIDQYRQLRDAKTGVAVHDATLGKDILLLSRDAFEQLVLDQLTEQDRADYLAYKAAATQTASKHQQ